jgi:hypothetical protein
VKTLIATCLLLFAGAVCAQSEASESAEASRVFGDYEVFFSVFPSTMLTEQVAGAYQIVRGKDRAIVNIVVRKHTPAGGDREHSALVTGTYSDLIQSKTLTFREIDEQSAIYYIAELRHNDRDLLRFDIKVQPDPNVPPYLVTFTRKLYIEP